MWAAVLGDKLVPGRLYGSQAEVDRFVSPRLFALHGNLWEKGDGYDFAFPMETRRLWLAFWKAAARRVAEVAARAVAQAPGSPATVPADARANATAAAAAAANSMADSDDGCFLERLRACVACGQNNDCWFRCSAEVN